MGLLDSVKSVWWGFFSRGKTSQDFLGAKWIMYTLKVIPESQRRSAALWFLSLSPHYFFLTDANRHMKKRELRETEFRRNLDSRRSIVEEIIKKYSHNGQTVLDYGCGPGFMAKLLSTYVKTVIACDISEGVIACATVLNMASNIRYLVTPSGNGDLPLEDSSVDLVYSFAVIQHVTNESFQEILKSWHRVLKNGGTILCHIAVDLPNWKSEKEWRDNGSYKGKMKWKYGLHCFGRTVKDVEKSIVDTGFSRPEIFMIRDFADIEDDDIRNQHLFVFRKEPKDRKYSNGQYR